jgi:hypothetical protein
VAFLLLILAVLFIQNGRSMAAETDPVDGRARLHQILQQEEELLRTYMTTLQTALSSRTKKEKSLRFEDRLPEEINTPQRFNQWLKERFPLECCRSFVIWQKALVWKSALPNVMDYIIEEVTKMMAIRKSLAEEYGELTLVLGNLEKRKEFQQKNAALAQKLIREGIEEQAFLEIFIPLEGAEIATQRWELTKAEYAKDRLEKRLADSGCIPLMQEVKEQSAILNRGPLAKMLKQKMGFYRDAFVFFYGQNLEAFLDKKTGIDHLWKHLKERQEDVKGVPEGRDLYACLGSQRHAYYEAQTDLKEWLTKIRNKEIEEPEKSSLKPLMDPKKTLDLEKSLSHLEEDGTTRIRYILEKEAEIARQTPDLEETPEELNELVETAKAAFEEMYAIAIQKWEETKPSVLS